MEPDIREFLKRQMLAEGIGEPEGALPAALDTESHESVAHPTAALVTPPAQAISMNMADSPEAMEIGDVSQPTSATDMPDLGGDATIPPPPEESGSVTDMPDLGGENMAPPQAPTPGDVPRILRDTPAAVPPPSFNSQAADLARRKAFETDSANRNRWALGEGLKEAFAIARGQHYSPQAYQGPSEEAFLEKGQALDRQKLQDYLNRRLGEANINLREAEAEKARRPTAPKPTPGAEDVPGLQDILKSQFADKLERDGYLPSAQTGLGETEHAPETGIGPTQKAAKSLPQSKEALKSLITSYEQERSQSEADKRQVRMMGMMERLPYVKEHASVQGAGEKAPIDIAKTQADKVLENRSRIDTARSQLESVRSAFHAVPGSEIAEGKFNILSPKYAKFQGALQGFIDKFAGEETMGAAQRGVINAYRHIMENPSIVTNAQMDGLLSGLEEALDAGENANEARLKGLPGVGVTPRATRSAEPKKYLKTSGGYGYFYGPDGSLMKEKIGG